MTKPKSKTKIITRSTPRPTRKAKSAKRSAAKPSKSAVRADTKQAQIIALLRTPAGATIASLAAATHWQQHSVRGFLAGVIRKKLGLHLVSETGATGRIYRLTDDKAVGAPVKRNVGQAA
jgi:hypothetical protein